MCVLDSFSGPSSLPLEVVGLPYWVSRILDLLESLVV